MKILTFGEISAPGKIGGNHMDERLQKQLDFILEIDKEKNIFRQTHLSGHGRNENDAEHFFSLSISRIKSSCFCNRSSI